jgi:hypothetical protein
MTVKELIEALQKVDPDADVILDFSAVAEDEFVVEQDGGTVFITGAEI